MACSTATFTKDPEAILDYIFDWSDWLATGEIITSATITVPTGLTKASQTTTTTEVIAWISGGVVTTTYRVECKITTNSNRTDVRAINIRVADRWC